MGFTSPPKLWMWQISEQWDMNDLEVSDQNASLMERFQIGL